MILEFEFYFISFTPCWAPKFLWHRTTWFTFKTHLKNSNFHYLSTGLKTYSETPQCLFSILSNLLSLSYIHKIWSCFVSTTQRKLSTNYNNTELMFKRCNHNYQMISKNCCPGSKQFVQLSSWCFITFIFYLWPLTHRCSCRPQMTAATEIGVHIWNPENPHGKSSSLSPVCSGLHLWLFYVCLIVKLIRLLFIFHQSHVSWIKSVKWFRQINNELECEAQ